MKRLLENVEQLNQILNGITNGITVQDPTGKLVFVNQAAARLMNCDSPEDALAKGGAAIIEGFKFFDEQGNQLTPMDLPGRRALAGEHEPFMTIGYTSAKHKGVRWTTISATPVTDETGKVVLAVNVLQDVTELKNSERRLVEANDRITKLLEQTLNI